MTYRLQWQGAFEAYAYKFAADNHWRVRHILFDAEDCLQECAVVFVRLAKVYGDAIDNPKILMALYKRMLIRQFIDYARQNKCHRVAQERVEDEAKLAPAYQDPPYLSHALAGASRELRSVLKLFQLAPHDLLEILLPAVPQTRWSAATEMRISRSWCRLARVAVREDLVTELRGLL